MASQRSENADDPRAVEGLGGQRGQWFAMGLAAVLLVAVAARVPGLPQLPPGLNQDEAANAWNAWCLLKTGQDQEGDPWPVFYAHGLGGNRTTLFLYFLMPFQAVGGLSIWTIRLPAAAAGVLAVWLLYWVTARLFDRWTGLLAAGFLALSPWHIQLSRWGHEACLAPLVVLASVAALIWAGLPMRDAPGRPVTWRALLAGLVVGVSCYGYASIRLFLPAFLTACAVANWRSWWLLARRRETLLPLLACALGVAVTFGPLAYQHVVHPEGVGKRAAGGWVWGPHDSVDQQVVKAARRYARHFGSDYLFVAGDRTVFHGVGGLGALHWYLLPLLGMGVVVLVRRARRSVAARVLLCGVLAYPVGDTLLSGTPFVHADGTAGNSLHTLRSAPGLVFLPLLAALGAMAGGRWLWCRRPRVTLVLAGVLVLAAVGLNVRFWRGFAAHCERPGARVAYHADFMAGLAWLKPRVAEVDHVFITARGVNMPYILTLVAVAYPPQRWFEVERERLTYEGIVWEHYTRVGKYRFAFSAAVRDEILALVADEKRERVVLFLRPGEAEVNAKPVRIIRAPDSGKALLLIYDVRI
jgi:4-amino-4-deoxy-L-arabinose transferase-like glycosyltransferase